MVAERSDATFPYIQDFAAATPCDRLISVEEDEFICVRAKVQIVRRTVYRADERFVRCVGSALDVRICEFLRSAGRRPNGAVGQGCAIRERSRRLGRRKREVGGGERNDSREREGKIDRRL